ncbi:MAG: CpaD family pilus assembly protein [Pseudomonadota bacterium]
MTIKTSIFVSLLTITLASCGTVSNGVREASTAQENHPITVDQQTVSLAIPVDATLRGLSREMHQELDALMTTYRRRGHGPMTITVPSGGATEIDAQQTAANVRSALNMLGLSYSEMRGATYRTGGENTVIVSFTQYIATGPVCGTFQGEQFSRLKNTRAPNFGCADQNNLAAMVADPRDLSRMQDIAPSNGTARAASVRTTRSFDEMGSPTTGDGGGGGGE